MVYIAIDSSDKDVANAWVVDNADPQGANTFIENRVGKCLISLPDNNSSYNQKMIEQFGTITEEEAKALEEIIE